jgi:hypothetical protein
MRHRISKLKLRVFIAMATLICQVHAQERTLPTDTDLRAAYCVKVVQSDLQMFSRLDSEFGPIVDAYIKRTDISDAEKSKAESALRDIRASRFESGENVKRLQSFILPRIASVDSTSMLLAVKRSDEDLSSFSARTAECTKSCNTSDTAKCAENCVGPELIQRLKGCRTLTWLPF